MNSIISNFDITKEALPDLLLRISQGKVQIPDLQRSFCWTDDLVIQLLASVSQGWPVGSILLLEQTNDATHDAKSGNRQFRPRPVEGTHCTNVIPTHLILDGQQRATALFMTLFSNAPGAHLMVGGAQFEGQWVVSEQGIEALIDPSQAQV